jgi:hypothetical protein
VFAVQKRRAGGTVYPFTFTRSAAQTFGQKSHSARPTIEPTAAVIIILHVKWATKADAAAVARLLSVVAKMKFSMIAAG